MIKRFELCPSWENYLGMLMLLPSQRRETGKRVISSTFGAIFLYLPDMNSK